jgi:phage shock protein A
LRKDNEDLLRLRNEVRQLRDAQKDAQKQLSQQAQSAQTEIQRAQAQIQAAQAQAAQAQAQAQAVQAHAQALGTNAAQVLTPEQQAFAARYGLNPQSVAQANACINNLRQIDAAIQQWALENRKTENTVPTAQDIAAYLRGGALSKCPAGGTYTLNAVSAHPTCSIPGHAVQ